MDVTDMRHANLAHTPHMRGLDLVPAQRHGQILADKQYHVETTIGILRYFIDSTRPDLSIVSNLLARCAKHPTKRRWRGLQQIAHYLCNTTNHGLLYTGQETTLRVKSDEAFANHAEARQSPVASIVYVGNCLVGWCTRRIKTVVTSTVL